MSKFFQTQWRSFYPPTPLPTPLAQCLNTPLSKTNNRGLIIRSHCSNNYHSYNWYSVFVCRFFMPLEFNHCLKIIHTHSINRPNSEDNNFEDLKRRSCLHHQRYYPFINIDRSNLWYMYNSNTQLIMVMIVIGIGPI